MIGAGPAGSTAAYRLAREGASVCLLDRARFPRNKPCGGGLTVRAVRELPFSVEPVVEDVVDRVELRLHYGRRFERVRERPLVLMTQRRRLDAFLAGKAAAAGADFRDATRATAVDVREAGVTVDTDRGQLAAAALVGADGANGVTARSLGLCTPGVHGVALEGNLPHADVDPARYRKRIVIELGAVGGGFGWIFPKGDHVNVGVGGWEHEGPRLRDELRRLCSEHGLPEKRLREVRGHRLPVAGTESQLARGRAVVVGDAAGLVDPMSGDGIYEAFVSSRLAATAVADLLAGRARTLEPYDAAAKELLSPHFAASWAGKRALDRFPLLLFTVARAEFVQRALERLARGDPQGTGIRRVARPALGLLAKLAGSTDGGGFAQVGVPALPAPRRQRPVDR